MKKKGSMLIEALSAVSIMLISTSFAVKSYYENSCALKERTLMQNVNEIINNIEYEFKYNLSKEEIEEILKGDEVGFKYDEKISSKLCNSEIKELAKGDDIIVRKCGEDSERTNFLIKADITVDDCILKRERRFTKSWWMNEE